MVVAHVKEGWMEAPGNLVAHIRVSPFYHTRKQVSICHLPLLSDGVCADFRSLPVVPLQ